MVGNNLCGRGGGCVMAAELVPLVVHSVAYVPLRLVGEGDN